MGNFLYKNLLTLMLVFTISSVAFQVESLVASADFNGGKAGVLTSPIINQPILHHQGSYASKVRF